MANEIAAKYDFKRMASRLSTVMWSANSLPSEYGAYRQLNKYAALGELCQQIKMMCVSLLLPDTDIRRPIRDPSDEAVEQLMKSIDPRGLTRLKVVRIDLPARVMTSKEARELAVKQAVPYGATDTTERVVLLDLNGQAHYLGVRLYQFGNYWKIQELRSLFADPRLTAGMKTTVKEYEAMLLAQ